MQHFSCPIPHIKRRDDRADKKNWACDRNAGKGAKGGHGEAVNLLLTNGTFSALSPSRFFCRLCWAKTREARKNLYFSSVHTTLSNILFPQSNNLDKPPSPEKRALESYRKEGGDIKSEVERNPPLYWNVERRGEKVKSKNYDSSSSFLFFPPSSPPAIRT